MIGNAMRPPFTTIVKYDLNVPAIKWRIGFGDDPELLARGVTDTGVSQMRNSIIVTESGLVFGAGRDNHIRAWDSDTGKQLWSSRFGGNFVGSPAMYEMDGKQYLLVPAASTAGGRGAGAGVPPTPGRGGRGAPPPYPDGVPQTERHVINTYGMIGNAMRPPFTTIVKYDLNVPTIKWRIGFGDDPELIERGVTGTGVTQMRNSIIVTESGLVFGAGRDNHIRAWDSDTGAQLWSARFGGNFLGSPAMYEMDGRQYLLVPAASTASSRGGGAGVPAAPAGTSQRDGAAQGPMGWVAYALPK
jgi:quinoprotein glucose dehydrogenase